ncbi:MAG: VanZ family protein [Eubacterium sp.]|nr:VanZ family protein [Eubacterium sp.]
MKKALTVASAVLFAVLFPFCMVSSSFSVKNSYFGFHSFTFIYIRYFIIIAVMFTLTYLNRENKALLNKYVPAAITAVSICAYIDYFITFRYLYNYGYLLWLGVVFSVTNAAVFLSATIFVKDDYPAFYKRFWSAYLVMYILIIYVSFIRNPDFQELSVNMQIGNGTIKFFKAVFNDPLHNLYTSLICFGNIFILLPAPFVIYSFKRPPVIVSVVIGMLLPLFFEGYQYILKCGNVDIDDILLNFTGFLIGLTAAEIIYSKKLKPSH